MNSKKILLPEDGSKAPTPWFWIGTWSVGGEGFGRHDGRESLDVLQTAAENNIRHFDTAGFYARGKSEKLLQKVIKKNRQEFFISSKGGLVWNGRNVEHRASPEALERQLSESLERLKTDYLDLFQLHWPDPVVPIGESISALQGFRQKGLIRFWGVGNLSAREIRDNLRDEENIPHQVHFNPIHRTDDLLLAGKDCCINCVISPLEQGLLGNGKSSYGAAGIGRKDMRNRNPFFSDPTVKAWNSGLNYLLRQHSLSKVFPVLLWICTRPHVHAVIPGPRRVDQLNELLGFLQGVREHDLCAAEGSECILSEEKVRSIIPPEIWEHLCKGPAIQS